MKVNTIVALAFCFGVIAGCENSTKNAGTAKKSESEAVSDHQSTKTKTTSEIVAVDEDFLLADISDQQFALLTFGRELLIPKWTYQLKSLNIGTNCHQETCFLDVISIYDGKFVQDLWNIAGDHIDLETGEILSIEEVRNLEKSANCNASWTPVRPNHVAKPQNGYWELTPDTVLGLKRVHLGKSIEFVHSDTNLLWADQLTFKCKDTPSDRLTFGHLKRLLNSENAVLQIER